MQKSQKSPCPLCGRHTRPAHLRQAGWAPPAIAQKLQAWHPHWQRADGACPACVQQALLHTLLEEGDAALHDGIQAAWPLDAEAAFGALPIPLRMHADPRFTGAGVTIAVVDSAFYPHPDLLQPHNRIRAWVDASEAQVHTLDFAADQVPAWPGWSQGMASQWHGLMTSSVAAGNGWMSHGLYRGLASVAELVLVQLMNGRGHIDNERIVRALRWIRTHAAQYNIRVVNLSLGGDPVEALAWNPVDAEVAALFESGISVVVAAGNAGERRLVPPATAPQALTIGGLDDKNTFDHRDLSLWHSNYGTSVAGLLKPELVAPSIWLAAPLLPGTAIAQEAAALFERRATGDTAVENRIAALKLVTPYYQHVDGTSFAAPIASSVIACMLQANPGLTAAAIRELLPRAAQPVPGVAAERQGAGALDAGLAVSLALRGWLPPQTAASFSPQVTAEGIRFLLYEPEAREVHVTGSWDGWQRPGVPAQRSENGAWQAALSLLPPARYNYKFLIDGSRWLCDPANPRKSPDGFGDLNSIFDIAA